MLGDQRFGEFFRQRRKARGASLREFCRQHGFDPGNISRLERGILKPPQSTVLLHEYGTALSLKPGSAEWNRLMDLAAAETGRLPPEIAENPQASAKLTDVLGAFRRERRKEGTWTSALDLETWAGFRDAQSQLPRLIRRLIRATVDVSRMQFPADEGVDRPGWDGLVEAKAGNEYVPAGLSVWEVGTSRNVKKKADEDFSKRTKDTLGLIPSETTFVFVTPRKWVGKDEWCQTKKELGTWADVRVCDSVDIEQWLELAPAVDAGFATLIGRKPAGVKNIDEYWEDLSAIAKPSLKAGVFLASRQEEVKWLENWLMGPSSSLAVEARSPAEVLDFMAAYVVSPTEEQDEENNRKIKGLKESASSRTLIVDNEDAWQSLAGENGHLVLVVNPGLQVESESVARAVRHGHHVLLSSHRIANQRTSKQILARCYRHDLEKALVASGFKEEEASLLARESGGSLTVLKRRIAQVPSTKVPQWADGNNAADLSPLTLIGAWDDRSDADRRAVERITGRSYAEVLAIVGRWSNSDDAPLMRILTRWSLMSREDAWVMLGPHLTRLQLDAFEELATEILGEQDPQSGLGENDRIVAQLQGKTRTHSSAIRTGIAETLGLMGSRPELVPDNGSDRAERIVRRLLFKRLSWEGWLALSRDLPVLAEAAPQAFLGAVRADVESSTPQLASLFDDDDENTLFSACKHSGLLWALEGLAWSPDHLREVSYLLAKLHELDKGKKWANRPLKSLVEIFLPWLPHTTVDVQGRIKVLRWLTERAERTGWKLLLDLLPSFHGISTPTHKPAWRPWVMNWSHGVTNAEYWQQVRASATRLLEMVGTNAERWKELITHVEHFSEPEQDDLISRLTRLDAGIFSLEDQKVLTNTIRNKVQRHRAHAGKEWAMPARAVEQLEAVAQRFEPKDLVAKNCWLFAGWPRLLDEPDSQSLAEREEKLLRMRQGALQEILTEGGISRAFELARSSESPGIVGFELGRLGDNEYDSEILPQLLVSQEPAIATLARCYLQARFNAEGWALAEKLDVDSWPGEQIACFALALGPTSETWKWVESKGQIATDEYWRNFGLYPLPKDESELNYLVSRLLQYGRPFSAIHFLAMSLYRKESADAELLMRALEAADGEVKEKPWQNLRHDLQEIFSALQSHPNILDRTRLARLEWGYLEILDCHGGYPETLHELLQSEPEFFLSALQAAFRSDNEAGVEPPPLTDEERKRGTQAYKLLMNWETPPGSSEDGTMVDANQLNEWVRRSRSLATESGHLKSCDHQIGQVFAHAPGEPDGTWPCIPVRDSLDEIDTEEAEHGFVMGILNKRGIYSKSPFEGGEKERELAAQFLAYADACRGEWHRVTAGLKSVARHYEEDASHEDARAESRK